jgi:hypothetical protein
MVGDEFFPHPFAIQNALGAATRKKFQQGSDRGRL